MRPTVIAWPTLIIYRFFWRKLIHPMQSSEFFFSRINPLSTNPTKWSSTLKQFVGKLPTNYLSVFDHFVKLAFYGIIFVYWEAKNSLATKRFVVQFSLVAFSNSLKTMKTEQQQKNNLHLKRFLFKKRTFFIKTLTLPLLFQVCTHCWKNHVSFKLRHFLIHFWRPLNVLNEWSPNLHPVFLPFVYS